MTITSTRHGLSVYTGADDDMGAATTASHLPCISRPSGRTA